jgi:hypothetical protein
VVDATGLKLYGEGEWKVRQHGYTKRRTWRKLHLGVDECSGEIVATVLSTNNVGDSEVLSDLLDQIDEPIEQLSAEGSYDTWEIHADLQQRGVFGPRSHHARRPAYVSERTLKSRPSPAMRR